MRYISLFGFRSACEGLAPVIPMRTLQLTGPEKAKAAVRPPGTPPIRSADTSLVRCQVSPGLPQQLRACRFATAIENLSCMECSKSNILVYPAASHEATSCYSPRHKSFAPPPCPIRVGEPDPHIIPTLYGCCWLLLEHPRLV
jgi:hypothetical protein